MSNQESGQSPVVMHDGEDPQMQRAFQLARQTFRYFWRELAWERRRIIPGLEVACVKVAFSDSDSGSGDGPDVEQMWINDVDFDGKMVRGTLINEPNWLKSVKVGDDVTIPPSRVNDWLYSVMGKACGAFTVNIMRRRMSKSERKQHDAAWGQDFGDPTKIRVVPDDYIGRGKKGVVAKLFGGGQKDQDLNEVAAHEHPMALNMVESLVEFCQLDPANVTSADDRGFTMLHDLALAGSARGCEVLLQHGADKSLQAGNGMTPFMLAKSLGWKNVMQQLG